MKLLMDLSIRSSKMENIKDYTGIMHFAAADSITETFLRYHVSFQLLKDGSRGDKSGY